MSLDPRDPFYEFLTLVALLGSAAILFLLFGAVIYAMVR